MQCGATLVFFWWFGWRKVCLMLLFDAIQFGPNTQLNLIPLQTAIPLPTASQERVACLHRVMQNLVDVEAQLAQVGRQVTLVSRRIRVKA